MPSEFPLKNLRFVAAGSDLRRTGLLGWVAFVSGPLRIDGVAVRRTQRGRLALSFPARKDAAGREHPYVRPINDDARRELERLILSTLEIER